MDANTTNNTNTNAVSCRRSVYEMKDVYGMFTMDTIASIAFGVSSDSLNNTQVGEVRLGGGS